MLSEDRDVPVAQDSSTSTVDGGKAAAEATRSYSDQVNNAATRRVAMPIVGLEVSIYTIPSSACALLYVSKVDTTGLSPSNAPSPARALVASFLAYHIIHPPHDTTRLRIHIFAKSQPMYLFPGSIENEGKKVLDDKGLIRWWKSTLTLAASLVPEDTLSRKTRMHYLIPGMSHLESLPYVPASTGSNISNAVAGKWSYGHGYQGLTSPLHPLSTPPDAVPLTDLIPCFPDDPKSRFVSSLTSSAVAPSGNQDDYDDVMLSLKAATFATGRAGGSGRRRDEVEKEKAREAARLEATEGGLEGWWEMMQWRQECCAGKMVAFFLLVAEPDSESTAKDTGHKEQSDPIVTSSVADDGQGAATAFSISASALASHRGPPEKMPCSLPQTVFIRLWSQFHNMDYNENGQFFARTAAHCEKWADDIERLLVSSSAADAEAERLGVESQKLEELKRGDDHDVSAGLGSGPSIPPPDSGTRLEVLRHLFDKEIRRTFTVDNPLPPLASDSRLSASNKRDATTQDGSAPEQMVAADAKPKVNMLAPRKKKPKV